VDVVGANCMEGPNVLFDVVARMVGKGTPIIAQPNAGYPRRVDERLVYMATPEYFGVYARRFMKAGVNIVGGCCGTSPEHVRSIAAAGRMMGGGRSAIHVYGQPSSPQAVEAPEVVPVAERTGLSSKIMRAWSERVRPAPGVMPAPLTRDNFAVSVEVNSPQGLDPAKSIEAAAQLLAGGVDVINIADGPRASARMSNWALANLMRKQLGNEIILHVCGRDRNLLGLMADILAYHALDLHNLVIVTGDPPKVGDYPQATAVFDLDSVGILRLVQGLNCGIDPASKPLGDATRFFCACGAEPAAQDYDRELRRLELKRAAGASFIMTQPVYDPLVLERFLNDTRHLDMPIMVGLLPLASYRNAEFLHNEVPGMSVPGAIRERMRLAGTGAAARAEGVRIAQETLEAVQDQVVGAYVMPPLGRYAAALEVMQGLPGWAVHKKTG
jgi:methionine synthase / methylenetetrahydrofolate reductase(NADPH)